MVWWGVCLLELAFTGMARSAIQASASPQNVGSYGCDCKDEQQPKGHDVKPNTSFDPSGKEGNPHPARAINPHHNGCYD